MFHVTNDYKLKFHDDFYDVIIDKYKTCTSRREPKPIDKGDWIEALFKPSNRTLNLQISDHYAVKFKDINSTIAEQEGYIHEDLLKHELKNIYPNIKPDDYIYIYEFEREL